MTSQPRHPGRYDRQLVYENLGPKAQRQLEAGRVLVVGVGGLGCSAAQLLARSGVGFLRLVDFDRVSVENIHRQVLFTEADAAAGREKVVAAARAIQQFNSQVTIEPVVDRFTAANAQALAEGVDLIVDGTDSFPARFIINDLAVRDRVPWIFAGVVGAEAQVMTIAPGGRPCLRCVFDAPPPPCADLSCRERGVIAPAVAAVAAFQAGEALKILSGKSQDCSPYLLKFDLWANTMQRLDVRKSSADVDCPCCKRRDFSYLHGE